MPTDYTKSSIYKILCCDGKFYVGSTVVPLKTRFGQHRRAVENGVDSKVYRHIRELGGMDYAHMELVAENLGITTRDELLKIEDSYIREGLKSKSCLNRNKPRATSEEREARAALQKKMWRDLRKKHPGDNEKTIGERVREYYRTHRRLPKGRRLRRDPEELVDCECGADVMRAQLAGHKKKKEHKQDLTRWRVIKRMLQLAGSIKPERPSLWDSRPV